MLDGEKIGTDFVDESFSEARGRRVKGMRVRDRQEGRRARQKRRRAEVLKLQNKNA